MKYITEEEARRKKLPGSDVFLRTHLYYKNDLHRDWAVVSLCREAHLALNDTHFLTNRKSRTAEGKMLSKWLDENKFDLAAQMPATPYISSFMEYMNYENFKIASAFELYLKSRLIEKNYVVHKIEYSDTYKSLSKEQSKRPIEKFELFKISGFCFNGKENFLPGILKSSLNFSTIITEQDYVSVFELQKNIIGIIDDFRELRNQIHLPGDMMETPSISACSNLELTIITFINSEIVQRANKLIQKHNFKWPLLVEISP